MDGATVITPPKEGAESAVEALADKPEATVWTPELIAALTQLWNEGVPTDEIAMRIGVRNKSIVIGKANRIGLGPHPNAARRKVAAEGSKPVGAKGSADIHLERIWRKQFMCMLEPTDKGALDQSTPIPTADEDLQEEPLEEEDLADEDEPREQVSDATAPPWTNKRERHARALLGLPRERSDTWWSPGDAEPRHEPLFATPPERRATRATHKAPRRAQNARRVSREAWQAMLAQVTAEFEREVT